MFKYSKSSLEKLSTCDERLQRIMKEVIKIHDVTIICGHRGEKEQNEAFENGFSKLRWPDGNHNKYPSRAVDASLYPIDWNNRERFIYFAGLVKGVAQSMGIKIRCGIDFNQDLNFKNDRLFDGPHFELVD
jgi:peptidoglycan L-alanyl-D-glutamate endopeptidase CwlK